MPVAWGISAGLVAAVAQTLSYFLSRRFMQHFPGGVLTLLATAHLLMGGASVVILLFLWPLLGQVHADCLQPLAGAAGFYMAGQAALFWTIRRVESSRLAPLLGLKILVLALITTGLLSQTLGPRRWAAVLMSVGAAFLLNEAGGRLPREAVAGLLVTLAGYCLSDIHIVWLVAGLAPVGKLAPLLGVALTYLLCGLVAGPLLLWAPRASGRAWRWSCPYAAAWFIGMIFLIVCFTGIGVVFGNIVQATRGIMSVALGTLVAHWGLHHLESRVPCRVFWQRLAGALLMLAAIAFYATG